MDLMRKRQFFSTYLHLKLIEWDQSDSVSALVE